MLLNKYLFDSNFDHYSISLPTMPPMKASRPPLILTSLQFQSLSTQWMQMNLTTKQNSICLEKCDEERKKCRFINCFSLFRLQQLKQLEWQIHWRIQTHKHTNSRLEARLCSTNTVTYSAQSLLKNWLKHNINHSKCIKIRFKIQVWTIFWFYSLILNSF